MTDLARKRYLEEIEQQFLVHPICALLGPRQCGKTTLARHFSEKNHHTTTHRFDLEDPEHLALLETPKLALASLEGLVIIDEIQLRPELFPYLRVLVDSKPANRYLILGSASRNLLRQSSESLAGRIGYVEMTPLSLEECGVSHLKKLWMRGGFPRSYLALNETSSQLWRRSYIQSFLERDLALLGFHLSPYEMRRLWVMLAHYHGNVINYAELARSLSISDVTARRHVEILHSTFMVRLLKPWHANIKKRQIKSPKIYLRDSGLLHTLLGIDDQQLIMHPKVGASWEGFALEEITRRYAVSTEDSYFWSSIGEAELDLLIHAQGKSLGFEFQYSDSPKITASMRKALHDLQLDELIIVVPGELSYPIEERIRVCGLSNKAQEYGF